MQGVSTCATQAQLGHMAKNKREKIERMSQRWGVREEEEEEAPIDRTRI